MSLKDVDFDAAFRRLADRRIEEAMKEGKFSNLEGAGKPLDLEPPPADENARMTWWALRILRQNDVVPHEVQWRKQIDRLKAAIHALRDDAKLEPLVRQVNDLVHKLNTLGTNALSRGIPPLDLETEQVRLRERLAASSRDG
ncbi:MAG TPA: DUF1992 domain-containing protein [Tepidisphaeraceae bacterium]|nr:DUF1992 domain-containing protein [Tepidisphaeraceae bacterium]